MTNPEDGCGRSLHLEERLRRIVRTSHVEGLLSPASWGGFNHWGSELERTVPKGDVFQVFEKCISIPPLLQFHKIVNLHLSVRKKDDIPPASRTPSLSPPSSFGWRHLGPRTSPQRISVSCSTRSCLLRSGRGRDGPLGPAQTLTSPGRPVEYEVKG